MAVPKFYRVIRGERGAEAKTKFLAYLTRLSPALEDSKIGTKGQRPSPTVLYVEPFGINLGTQLMLQTSALSTSWNAVKGIGPVAARTKEEISSGKSAIKMRGGSAARVRATTGLASTGVKDTSHLTGLHYLKYNGTSLSFPFGQNADTESLIAAFNAIKAALPGNYKRIGLIEENL